MTTTRPPARYETREVNASKTPRTAGFATNGFCDGGNGR
jgi:hypothetical protein